METMISSEETTVPTGETTAPAEETTAPAEETTAPTEETTAPAEETTAPTEETTVPVEETTAPTEETTAPTEETTIPTEVSVLSVDLRASCGENLTWELDAEGTLTISGIGAMTNYTSETETPWYADRGSIQKIVVSEGVTSVGDNAFNGCFNLGAVSLPQSLVAIGSWSFADCYDLASVTIPARVTEIGYKAFEYYGAKMVRIICLGDVPQTPDGFPFFERSGYGLTVNVFYDVSNGSWTEEAKQAFSSSESTKLNFIPCSNMSSTSGTCGDGLTWSVDLDKKSLTISGSGTMDSWGEASAAPWNCFADLLESVVVGEGVFSVGENAFAYVKSTSYQFQGTVPAGIEAVLEGNSLAVYYPADDGNWQNLKTQYPDIDWIANGSALASLDELMAVYKTMTPAEIRATVQSWDREELKQMMFSGENSLDLSYLEEAVCPEYPVVYITENVPKLYSVPTDPLFFGVQGARLNNLLDDSQVPTLTLDKVGNAVPVPDGYLSADAVQFSIQLGNLENPENLAVPISINIVLPDDMNPFFQGLFWWNPQTGEVEALPMDVYWSKTGGMRTGFVITGAGDYVFAQKADASVSGTCGDNLTWTYDSSYTLTISGTGEMYNYNESDNLQPWYQYGESVKRIVLEEGVTSIGDYAFGYNCRFPDAITIPTSVKRIGAGAFSDVFTTKFIFEGNVPEIAQDSFKGLRSYVYYPGDDESWSAVINNPQWGGADEITWMPLSHSGSCGENLTWSMDEETGTLTISGTGDMDSYVFMDYPDPPWNAFYEKVTKAVLEEGVTSIGDMAFGYCTNLQELLLPDSLTTIGAYALPMANFEELTIPAGVTNIDPLNGMSDDGRGDLQNVWVDENNTAYSSIDGVLFNKDQTTLVLYPSGRSKASYTVPEGTQMIGEGAFWKNNSLRSVTLPSSLTKIGESAFIGTRLEEIVIPENVVSIGGTAFSTCNLLKKVIFQGDAPEIGESCFNWITTTVYYPAGNDTWTEDVRQDYNGTLTWVSYEPEEPTQGMTQAEFLEALDSAIAAGKSDYQLSQSVVLTESVVLPEITIRISGEDTVLTVSDGVTLDGNGQYVDVYQGHIVVEDGGILTNTDITVSNGADLTVEPGGTLICDDQAGVLVWFNGALYVMDGAILQADPGTIRAYLSTEPGVEPTIVGVDKKDIAAMTEFLSVPEDADFAGCFAMGAQYMTYKLSLLDIGTLKSDLVIPQGVTFETTYSLTVPQSVTVTNNGTMLVASGDFVMDGTLVNNGTFTYYSDRQLQINGTFQGNAPELADVGTLAQEELESMIREAVETGEWLLGFSKQVELTRDLEIPAGITLEVVQGGGFTLTEGVTLTCSGEITLYNCATLRVCDGATLEIPGELKLSMDSAFVAEKGAVVKIQGSLTIKDADLRLENGSDIQSTGTFQVSGEMDTIIPLALVNTIDGLLEERTTVTAHCATAEELASAVQAGQAYRSHQITAAGEICLAEDITVPANCTLALDSGAVLQIPEGVTLTNLGTIALNAGSKLQVEGTLDDQGKLVQNGGVITGGEEDAPQTVEENLETIWNNADSLEEKEIREQVQSINRDELAAAMEEEQSTAVEQIKQLESKLTTTTVVRSDVESVDAAQVTVVGAGLNNVTAGATQVVLVIDTPEDSSLVIPEGYDTQNVLAFSMTLENVENTEELAVPVRITLPVPTNFNTEDTVILHYHSQGQEPDVIYPQIVEDQGKVYAAFVVTGFSDFVIVQRNGTACSHVYKDWKDNQNGTHSANCQLCNQLLTEDHTFGAWEVTKAATCKVQGERQRKCTKCGAVETEVIPISSNHTYDDVWTDCKDGNKHMRVCTVCGQAPVQQAHQWDDGTVTVSGTCGKAGEKTYTCDVCGATRTEVIPATGAHDFTYQYVDNADGKTHTAFCDCGAKTTENHAYTIYGTVLEQATTRKDGKREMLCICGAKTVIAIPKEDAQLDDVPKTGDITGQVLLCSASAVLMLVAIVYLLKRKLGNNP